MDKFKNKYRIPSARLQNWDYGSDGSYFITICTKGREHFFGEIINDEIQLSKMGKLAEQFWIDIPTHFPFIELGNFVVMPNHVHGILIIDKTNILPVVLVSSELPVETRLIASLQSNVPSKTKQIGGFSGNKNPMLNDNISRIIRWYKGRCSFEIKKINADFEWQSRFHDHIIRDAESFERIQDYIENNPINWKNDKFYI